jgi:predicted secreted protein with PEFG-CTERM motif
LAINILKTFISTLTIILIVVTLTIIPSAFSEIKISTPMITAGVVETSYDSNTKASDKETKSGTIIVESPSTKETTVHGLSSDGKVRVEITASNPAANEIMSINIKFRDSSGALKKFANYDILVTQNNKEVLSSSSVHEEDGNGTHITIPLDSDGQVDFKITLLGFGLKEDQANWLEPKGDVLMLHVVPEFGTISMMILIVSIISAIIITAKTKNMTIP